ncbi:MAG: SurA N-terminal domain-containing protein [Idiomarina sp.]|nr:SurA N-terminal domain-containing protein [Idiomarina sp.]
MLERIREGAQGPVVKVIIFLIVVAFALTGVNAYLGGSTETYVAKVNGTEISRVQFDRAYQNQRAMLEEQYGEMFQMLAADEGYTRQLRASVLEQLIEDQLTIQLAQSLGMRQSPDVLRQMIRELPDFQINGQFSNDLYNRALMSLGFTPSQFRQYMEEQSVRVLMLQGAFGSEFALPNEVDRLQVLQNERRSGRYTLIRGEDFLGQVELSDEEIEAWYFNNQERFEVEEQIQLAYVELRFDDVVARTTIDDDTVREYYDRNPAAFSAAEQRRIAHILVEFGADEAAARVEAETLLAEIRAGADFVEVAARSSQDIFSAEDGGDLGTLERGAIDPDIEDAGFALQSEGEVSDVVRSEFGFHIVKLTQLSAAQQTSFDEVADEIRENLARVEAETEYFRLQQELARMSFEIPDSLDEVAQELGLTIRQSPLITRGNPPSGFDSPQLLTQAFSSDVTERELNSELIELSERSIVVRAENYEPPRIRPLDEVRDTIVSRLQRERAQELALSQADEIVAQMRARERTGRSFEYIEAASRFGADLPGEIRQRLFRMALNEESPEIARVSLNTGDVAVLELTGVTPGIADEELADRYSRQLEVQHAERLYQGLMNALKSDADIRRRL